MFNTREWFESEEAYQLYHDACAFAHAPGSCVFDKYEAFECNCKAVGMLLMAQEMEPNNPHVAWMLMLITDFNYHSTDYLIDLSIKTLKVLNQNRVHEHLIRVVEFGLEKFKRDRDLGVLMTA
jgi:hypothetical protein